MTDLTGKKVVLIDGSGYIFRAYYALPTMKRFDGTPVNAVYGFCTMITKLVATVQTDYLAVMFDAARKTFRNEIYPEYKATRRDVPEDLIPQFPLFREAVAAFNVSCAELDGYEADDLLATYARLAQEAGAQVTIISADKDLMQLMTGDIRLYDPIKHREVTQEAVLEKFGVTPDKVIDVQSLAGDSTDNIPGILGIGVKTAAELINEYGSLDELLARAHEIKRPKRRQLLTEQADMARLSRKLVTLNAFAPVTIPVDSFEFRQPDEAVLRKFLIDQSFRTLADRLPERLKHPAQTPQATPSPQTPDIAPVQPIPQGTYKLIQTSDELARVLNEAKQAGIVAVDTETDSLSPLKARIAGFSISYKSGEAYYVPLRHKSKQTQQDLFGGEARESGAPEQIPVKDALEMLRALLEDKTVLKVGHNIKYDMHVFANEYGAPVDIVPYDDTMLLSYVLDGMAHGHGMDELAKRFFDRDTIHYKDVCGTGNKQITFDYVPLPQACDYAAEDADVTFRLHVLLKKRLGQERMTDVYEILDRPLLKVLFDMERAGIMVDDKHLESLSRDFAKKIAALETRIFELAGETFNLNSPAQLGKILFDKLKLPDAAAKTKKGTWSTDADVLSDLAGQGHEIASLLLDYRQFSKLKSTYTDALQEQINKKTGRVHTVFFQAGTSTGRLSSSDPNLQNIPVRTQEGRDIRKAFIAKPEHLLISADYSQVELRLMAHVADVKKLKDAFLNGMDIHAATASEIFNIPLENMDPMIRRRAKAINFGIIYGISAFGLANQLDISRTEAKEYIEAYFAKYPEIKEYMNDTAAFGRAHGYVETPFGRKCYVGDLNSKRPTVRSFAERAAANAPIQGGAADILKKAMNALPDALKQAGLHAKLLLQVHDELVLEASEAETEQTRALVKTVMENAAVLSVPLIADAGVGKDWTQAH